MGRIQRILIDERSTPAGLGALTRIRSFVEIRDGILNPLQRLREQYSDSKLFYTHSNPAFQKTFFERNPKISEYDGKDVDLIISPEEFLPWKTLGAVGKNIEQDLDLNKDLRKWARKLKVKSGDFQIVGKSKHLHIHPSAKIYPGVVIDVSSGPVIIDKDVKVTSFTFLEGPLYLGQGTHVDNARITGGTSIGHVCRIGGEVGDSIILDFTNKHHEGFLGHSLVGSWVNLGALSTTSDLKNNYGVVKIREEGTEVTTGSIKFGSIIGDFSKVGIGVMLNTGTVIDFGCNVISQKVTGYLPPFIWADGQAYILDLFLRDSRKIMARRNREMSASESELIRILYETKVRK